MVCFMMVFFGLVLVWQSLDLCFVYCKVFVKVVVLSVIFEFYDKFVVVVFFVVVCLVLLSGLVVYWVEVVYGLM